jgi:hypothetical protein
MELDKNTTDIFLTTGFLANHQAPQPDWLKVQDPKT